MGNTKESLERMAHTYRRQAQQYREERDSYKRAAEYWKKRFGELKAAREKRESERR